MDKSAQIFYDSTEAEHMRKLIANKESYIQTLLAANNKVAYQIVQAEIMFLKNDIFPIVLTKTNYKHDEFSKFAVKCFDTSLLHKCNGLLIYQPIDENYIDRPKIGFVNPRANQQFGTVGAMEVFVEMINMDGNGAKVNPYLLPLKALHP